MKAVKALYATCLMPTVIVCIVIVWRVNRSPLWRNTQDVQLQVRKADSVAVKLYEIRFGNYILYIGGTDVRV